MSFSTAFLDELRSKVSLAEIAGAAVTWDKAKTRPAKGDYWSRCPFHSEKSSSFHVDDQKGYYYCFGCHEKGGVIDFMMKTRNMGFPEAVEALARHAGMPLPARDSQEDARRDAESGLIALNDSAIRFYKTQLHGAAGRSALSYLEGRGLTRATMEAFGLGYAPGSGDALARHLAQGGAKADDLVTAGLCARRDDGSLYDRFRNRVMFPIHDGRGRAIAFGGRALSNEDKAKYLNSPETPLFHKGSTLFNLSRARAAAGKAGEILVVEGYMDAISLHQAGFAQVVAPLGTALTEDHLKLLWRMADEPTILLDGDAAGQRAANRAIDLALPLLEGGKSLRFVSPPAGRDPDDVAREGGAAAVAAMLKGAEPLVERLWRRETAGRDLTTPERRAGFDSRIRELLGVIRDPNLREHYREAIRERRSALFAPARAESGPEARFLRGEGWGQKSKQSYRPVSATKSTEAAQGAARPAARRALEATVLLGCLRHPELIERFETELSSWDFSSGALDSIRGALLSSAAALIGEGAHPTFEALCEAARRKTEGEPEELLSAYLPAGGAEPFLKPEAPFEAAAAGVGLALDRLGRLTNAPLAVVEDEERFMAAVDARRAGLRAMAEADDEAPADRRDQAALAEVVRAAEQTLSAKRRKT